MTGNIDHELSVLQETSFYSVIRNFKDIVMWRERWGVIIEIKMFYFGRET